MQNSEIIAKPRVIYWDNVWCYEQVCLAEMFKLPKMLLANLLIARVSCLYGATYKHKLSIKH